MTEIEVPLEQAQEHIQHEAQHSGGGHDSGGGHSNWIMTAALLSALLAVFAAVAALLAGHYANEAMLEQIKSSDQWSFFQSKGIKAAVLEGRKELMLTLGKEVDEKVEKKLAEYEEQKKEISEKASHLEHEAEHTLHKHETLAKSVTFFQIAIAITAIAVLVRKRRFLLVSLGFGAVGVVFLALGLSI